MRIPSPPKRHGGFIFMRPGCFGLLITLALLIGGGQMVYTAVKNREPVKMSVKDYLAKRPSGEWVQLSDAHCDLAECATSGMLGAVSELYIPVRSPGDTPGKQVKVLLKTRDAKLVALMQDLSKAGKNPTAMAKVIAGNAALLSGPRDVSGVVQFGIESDDKKRSKLAKLGMNLAPDFVIIADGEQPSLGTGFGLLGGGLLLGFFMLRRASAQAAESSTPPPLPPNLPPRNFGDSPPPAK